MTTNERRLVDLADTAGRTADLLSERLDALRVAAHRCEACRESRYELSRPADESGEWICYLNPRHAEPCALRGFTCGAWRPKC
jgi:hypothetical protein